MAEETEAQRNEELSKVTEVLNGRAKIQPGQYSSRVHVLNCSTSLSYYKGWSRQPTAGILVYFRCSMHYSISFLVLERPFPVIKTQKTRFVIWLQKKKRVCEFTGFLKKSFGHIFAACGILCRNRTHVVCIGNVECWPLDHWRFLLGLFKPFLHVCMPGFMSGVQLFATYGL